MKRHFLFLFFYLIFPLCLVGLEQKLDNQDKTLTQDAKEFSLSQDFQKIEEFLKSLEGKEVHYGLISIADFSSAITEATWVYVNAALQHFKQFQVDFILLHLDTPGGEVLASQKIADLLQDFDFKYQIPVVALVHHRAYSAGALLAYSCRYILTHDSSSMGAAEVVIQDAGGIASAGEKMNSAFRADLKNRAAYFKREPLIAEAMVDKDVLLVKRSGQFVKLQDNIDIRQDKENPDLLISEKGKLLTLNAQELEAFQVADFVLGKQSPKAPLETLLAQLPHLDKHNLIQESFDLSWKERFLAFLISPLVSSLLFMGLIWGFYFELSSPGIGLPAIVAFICLGLIGLSSVSLETISYLDVGLIGAGALLLLTELFIIPGFGVLGFLGIIGILMGFASLLIPEFQQSPNFIWDFKSAMGQDFLMRLGLMTFGFTLSAFFLLYYAKQLFYSPLLKPLVAFGSQEDSKSFATVDLLDKKKLLGKRAITLTVLKPSGKIKVEQKIYEASALGTFVEKGEEVHVVDIRMNQVIVQRLEN